MRKILIYLIAFTFLANSSFAGITFWTTEVQPARMEKQKEMAKAFEAKSGISVEVIPVEEKDLGKRATAAAAAGDLPDVIYHTLQYVLPWAEAGILDVNANNAVVKSLGKDTFAPGALNMAKKVEKSLLYQLMAGHRWLFTEKIYSKNLIFNHQQIMKTFLKL